MLTEGTGTHTSLGCAGGDAGLTGKKIILFGAGLYGKQGLSYFGARNVHCFVDNKKHGGFYLGKRVISFEDLTEIHRDYDVIISASIGAVESIRAQCDDAGIPTTYLSGIIGVDDFESDPRLAPFRNRHAGQRCFLVGNGPSLKAGDLEKIHINGDIAFGCNSIYRIFSNTSWRPDYYVVTDTMFMMERGDEISQLDLPVKLVADSSFDFLKNVHSDSIHFEGDNTYIFNTVGLKDLSSPPRFSHDPSRCVFFGKTVMYSMLQWAAYMGFGAIYLTGVDCTPAPLTDPNAFKVKTHFYDIDQELEKSYQKYIGVVHLPSKDEYLQAWINAYTSAETYSREHDFRIYNATRGGQLEVFERVDFDSLF